MSQARSKLWTKDFITISITNFFLYFVFYLLLVTMTVYVVERFGASESTAGLATGIFIIGTLISRLFIGRIIHSIGNKKILYIGLISFIATSLLYFIPLGISFLLITRFLQGLALGIASTATGTIVADIIPIERKGEGISYYSMSITIATAIGPFIGIYLGQQTTYTMIFALCASLAVVSLVIAFFVNVPEPKQTTISTKTSLKFSDFIEPKALPIAVIIAILSLGYASVLSFINFYAIEINLVETASLFFVVYAIAILVSRPFTGRLMDIKGANAIMYPAFILFSSGLLLLSVTSSSVVFLIAGALIGLGYGNMQSTTQAIAIKVTSPERVGLATSTYYIALDAGLGFGPYILGFLIPISGYHYLYVIMGVMVFVTILLYFLLHGKREKVIPYSWAK